MALVLNWGANLAQQALVRHIADNIARDCLHCLPDRTSPRYANRPRQPALPGGTAPQVTIRRLGAPLVATFLAVHLLAAVAASGPLLHEPIDGVWEASGVTTVVATLTWYLIVQRNVGS